MRWKTKRRLELALMLATVTAVPFVSVWWSLRDYVPSAPVTYSTAPEVPQTFVEPTPDIFAIANGGNFAAALCPLILTEEIHDADTLRGDVYLPFGVVLHNEGIRLPYDSWEVDRTRTALELTEEEWLIEIPKGKKARDEFKAFAADHQIFIIPNGRRSRDKYGRLLADVLFKDKQGRWHDPSTKANECGWIRY